MRKTIKILWIAGLFFWGACMSGCSKIHSGKEQPYLARVGSAHLTLREARKNIPSFAMKQDSIEALTNYRNRWIHHQLIINEANKLQLAGQKKVQQQLKAAHDEVLINALQQHIMADYGKKSRVSDDDAISYYKKNRHNLVLDEKYVKFRHLKTQSFRDARRARNELQKDSLWAHVALKYSLTPQKQIKKSSKIWPVSSLFNNEPVLKRYVSTLDSSHISPIRRIGGIYHFIQLIEVHDQGDPANPRWFSRQLKDWLTHKKQRNYYNSYVKNLYLKAKQDNEIEVFNVSTPTTNDKVDSVSHHTHE